MSGNLVIRSVVDTDRQWIQDLLVRNWGGECIVSDRIQCFPQTMDGFIAWQEERVGVLSYIYSNYELEIVLLEALHKQQGIGTALMDAVKNEAVRLGCARIDLYTTNDNLDALRFYQRRGFSIVAVHPGSMVEARQIKPGIPEIGDYGIPMTTELKLQLIL